MRRCLRPHVRRTVRYPLNHQQRRLDVRALGRARPERRWQLRSLQVVRSSYEGAPTGGFTDGSHGRYAVDGYLLTLRYENGKVKTRGLVSAPDEWL
jgi:hypothetical protein